MPHNFWAVRNRLGAGFRSSSPCLAGFEVILYALHPNTGIETTRRLRRLAHGAEVPIIAVTASALKEDVERCLATGMTDFLAKPFQLNDLAAVLDRWLL